MISIISQANKKTNSLLQKKTTQRPLTIPSIIITKDKITNYAHIVSNTPSLTRLLTPNYAIIGNIHFATKQTHMTINNTNQQVTDNIDLAKKTNANYQ